MNKLPLRIRIAAICIRLLSWITKRQIQPGAFIVFTQTAVMLVTPDGYNVILTQEAAREIGQSLGTGYEIRKAGR